MRISTTTLKCLGYSLGIVATAGLVFGLISCGTAPTPFLVQGPNISGNDPPTLVILEPNENTTLSKGSPFLIRWTDRDRDSNALISFSLVNATTNARILLVENIDENDSTGPDSFTVGTQLVAIGTYNLLGVIDDSVNPPQEVFASNTSQGGDQRVIITVAPEGQGPQTVPPVITVTEPAFNLSVAQEDTLRIVIQPKSFGIAAGTPFDPDSELLLFILADVDLDPNNDDPANPDPSKIIVLSSSTIAVGAFEARTFEVTIDLAVIPPRPGGEPYFIRATVDDRTNPRVHQYAVGTINVVQLASGLVDLNDIGKTRSGGTFKGFNPGANVGSSISTVGDFDADGVEDFVIVAQFGNPRNVGPVGEAYLLYGQNQIRFGGTIPVNSISETVSGVIFEAPPVRRTQIRGANARTDGITDVSFIRDLSGDGRPEILFGLAHTHGMYDGMDYDPADEGIGTGGGDDTVQIEVKISQGLVTVQEGQGDAVIESLSYSGVVDTTLSSADPNVNFGSETRLDWEDNGAGQRVWSLIKFQDVLAQIPDDTFLIDPTSLNASLEFRVFNTGGDAALHQVLTDFTEQTTFSTFAVAGGEPQEGVDYLQGDQGGRGIGNLSADTAETVTVDISTEVRTLLDGELAGSNDELRFIFVPSATDGTDAAALRSSEFSTQTDRPTLTISYSRLNVQGSVGCYPDNHVNNLTDTDAADRFDRQFTAVGAAIIVNSQNRDARPAIDPSTRLNTTSIALELVGQEPAILDSDDFNEAGGSIFVRADNDTADVDGFDAIVRGRIAGARFVAGHFDFVDHLLLNQPPREGLFGQNVASIGDLNNDDIDEIVISAPTNERHLKDLFDSFGFQSTHIESTVFKGSIIVIPGTNYNDPFWSDTGDDTNSSHTIPFLDQQRLSPFGRCTNPPGPRHLWLPADVFQVFAEDVDDFLGGASSAGDFNQDGIDDILCGAPLNDRSNLRIDTGAMYVLYGRNVLGDFNLTRANDPILRPPMLRLRGVTAGDQIGWRQSTGLDVNGDRIDDVFVSSPRADFGGVRRTNCGDANRDGIISSDEIDVNTFSNCRNRSGDHVFSDDFCKQFDYDNDEDIDEDDLSVLTCLAGSGTNCCDTLVDNGFVGIIFGGRFVDGDRDISQIAGPDLPGAIFFGSAAGHRAGLEVSSAGDFNQDGFGDILISVPGEVRLDTAGRERLGVVYLIFGGTHLENTIWNLSSVGSDELPGIIFLSPYVKGRPNEAAPTAIAFIGDINGDGFGDICIGNPKADFIDPSFPQGPNAPGSDASAGRRSDAGDAYVIYGNNFGSNRAIPGR